MNPAPIPELRVDPPGPEAEYCWRCGGRGKVPNGKREGIPIEFQPCHQCHGTGYGENIRQYRARIGVKKP